MWAQQVKERKRYCNECERYVLARENQFNIPLHAAMILFTCGLWFPIFLVAAVWFQVFHAGYLCPRCGENCG